MTDLRTPWQLHELKREIAAHSETSAERITELFDALIDHIESLTERIEYLETDVKHLQGEHQ